MMLKVEFSKFLSKFAAHLILFLLVIHFQGCTEMSFQINLNYVSSKNVMNTEGQDFSQRKKKCKTYFF